MKTNDYELVLLAQEGNEDAINLLYKKYTPIIVKKSKNAIFHAPHHGIDIDDIIQESFIGFDEAIRNFSQDGDAKFYTFAMLCVQRQISNYMRKLTNSRDKALNEAVTIDDTMEKMISDNTDIELSVLGKDADKRVITQVKEKLTDLEKKVLDMRLKDYKLDEIANILEKDKKAIYNAFQRIKTKFKKINEIDD